MTTTTKSKSTKPLPPKGEIKVADEIVEKIARIAAREIEGVAELPSKGSGLKQILNFLGVEKGIKVEVGTREVAVDIDISVEYGSRIPEIVRSIRKNITEKITQMTGLKVVELNIRVNDIHFSEETMPLTAKHDTPEPRVK